MAVSPRSYQSQTFRRLMAGYGRLSNWGQAQLNRLTQAASWSFQVVLYPIYVGFQSTRLVYRRLRASSIHAGRAGHGRWRSLLFRGKPAHRELARGDDPPVPDMPIRYVMATLQGSAPKVSALTTPAPLPLALTRQVRGLACDLAHQSLCLVDRQGQPINLTRPQQDYLHQLIGWVLADYAYRWHRHHQRQRWRRPLPPATPQPLAWRPVRQFYRLMGWMQQAAVAPSINLFQESYWLPTAVMPLPRHHAKPPRGPSFQQFPLVLHRPDFRQPDRWRHGQPAARLEDQPAFETALCPAELIPSEPSPTAVPPRSLTDSAWIETQAVLVGYVDHPLVLVLRWLDQALLWLEAKARYLWRRVQP